MSRSAGWCIDGFHDKNGERLCMWDQCECSCHIPKTRRVKTTRAPVLEADDEI